MRIAQIAPLAESVPPRLYGGTERIVSFLTEELVRQGHDVTLFASGDSQTSAHLVAGAPMSLRLNPDVRDHLPHNLLLLEEVRRRADEFDVLHFHVDLLHFPLMRAIADRTLTTLHGRLDLPDLHPFYEAFAEMPLASISDAQRRPMPPVNWVRTVHNALPRDLLPFNPTPTPGYLAFIGRISPEKRPDLAIEISRRSGLPLRIAAKVDNADRAYWDALIRPLIETSPTVEFIGEIDDRAKADFLGNASALLFPIDWPEPFGLAMIEAMSCGTPIIAFPAGSVPEIIEHGVSGFIVLDVEGALRAIDPALCLPRRGVRDAFERRFTAERMAADYLAAYAKVAESAPRPVLPHAGNRDEPDLQSVA